MRTKPFVLAAGLLILAGCEPTIMSLEVGTCFNDPDSFEAVADVAAVDCALPHDNEVFANKYLTGTEYPGDSVVTEQSGQLCLQEFEGYIGLDYESSHYDFGWLNPTEETWQYDDREVICFAYHMGFEKIRGTLLGIGE